MAEPRSNIEWRQWAQADPLYGVATIPGRERDSDRPWTLPEFYACGARVWDTCLPHWREYGLWGDHCVEIGCGAGRITRHLAGHFDAVTGVDVSEDMLAIAREHVADATFAATDGTSLPVPDAAATAVFSCEVFQHFDTRDVALTYFREMHRVLQPGGSLMVQLPLAIMPLPQTGMQTKFRALWQAGESWVRLKANLKRALIARRGRRPFLFMLQYEPEWLRHHLPAIGFQDLEIRMFEVPLEHDRVLYAHVFARKP